MLRDPLRRSTRHFQSEPRQLCFCLVYACLGTLSSTKMEPINWKYWTFYFAVNKEPEQFCCWQTPIWIIHNFSRQIVQVFKCFGGRVRKFSGWSLPPFSFCYWTVRILTFSLPPAAACKMEERSVNLDNSTLGYFVEFRQFHFNSGLGYITYVRLYHHAGNDIH